MLGRNHDKFPQELFILQSKFSPKTPIWGKVYPQGRWQRPPPLVPTQAPVPGLEAPPQPRRPRGLRLPAPLFPSQTELNHSCELRSLYHWFSAFTSQGQPDNDTCTQTCTFMQKWQVPTARLTRGVFWNKTDFWCYFYKRRGEEYLLYTKANDPLRTLKVSITFTPSSPNQGQRIIPPWLNCFKFMFSPLCSPQV